MKLPEKLPTGSQGATAASNGGEPICSCGETRYSDKSPNRCANGHLLRGNRAAAITGAHGANFRREHGGEIEQMADQFARDAGYSSLKAAPLGFQIAAIALSRTAKIGDLAYWRMLEAGGPMSESGKPRRAYSIWADTNRDLARDLKSSMTEVVAARPPGGEQRHPYEDLTTDQLIALADRLGAELRLLKSSATDAADPDRAELLKVPGQDAAIGERLALPESGGAQAPSPGDPRTPQEAAKSRSASTTTSPSAAGAPYPALRDLTPPPDSGTPVGRPRTRAATWSDGSRPAADLDAEPAVYAHGRRVTERDVLNCLRDTGDEHAYVSGRITVADAYERTRQWLRAAMEMR